jgi:hypothetical protein
VVGAFAGCIDLSLVREVAFPPAVPGLATDQPWISLPVGAWLLEGDLAANAVAACASPACPAPSVVGLFTAKGRSGTDLAAAVDRPERLVRALQERSERRDAKRAGPRRPEIVATVAAERLREGAFSGVLVRLSRPDGSRPAVGAAVTARRAGAVAVVVVVTTSEDGARRLVRDVVAGLA